MVCWICNSMSCKVVAKITYSDYCQQTYDLRFFLYFSCDNCDCCTGREYLSFSQSYCSSDNVNDFENFISTFLTKRLSWYQAEIEKIEKFNREIISVANCPKCPICLADYRDDYDCICLTCWYNLTNSDIIEYKTCLATYNYTNLFKKNPHRDFPYSDDTSISSSGDVYLCCDQTTFF